MSSMDVDELIGRAARDLVKSNYAIALTGAGISTESGISDFRGSSGIWTKDPEAERRAYQTYYKFLANPKEYWKERLSGPGLLGNLSHVQPNPGHHALAELEKMEILKCIITQNVDNLHRKAGNKNVLEYHGNAFRLRCISCNARFELGEFDLEKLAKTDQLPPHCPNCQDVIKFDVVHFNEPIPSDVARQSTEEARKCDLMLICGTSAVVYPFASLPEMANPTTTVIEINAEPTPLTGRISDYLIQGKTGEILPKIVNKVKQVQRG